MKCPICDLDLSPLDLISRNEHVDLCIENGPSVLELDESGQLVVKRNLPPGKQRKICPICDKTFQNLNSHFKTCAIKNDVPPNLMLDHWDKINSGTNKPKKFPRELLDAFVAKSIKEGRLGDQVDFARALSLSIAESEPESSKNQQPIVIQQQREISEHTNGSVNATTIEPLSSDTGQLNNANRVLMQNAFSGRGTTTSRRKAPRKRFRLEEVDQVTKRANVELRIERELAATRTKRYHEALLATRPPSSEENDSECEILDHDQQDPAIDESKNDSWRIKLFFLSRMKDCNGSKACLDAACLDHELMLLASEFRIYSGTSMDAPSKKHDPSKAGGSRCDANANSQLGETSGSAEHQQQPQQQQEQQQDEHEPALA